LINLYILALLFETYNKYYLSVGKEVYIHEITHIYFNVSKELINKEAGKLAMVCYLYCINYLHDRNKHE